MRERRGVPIAAGAFGKLSGAPPGAALDRRPQPIFPVQRISAGGAANRQASILGGA